MSPSPLPPQPSMSALAQTRAFMKNPLPLIREAFDEHGDIFTLHLLGLGKWVFVCSPELAKTLFKTPSEVLSAGAINKEQIGFLLGTESVLCLDGAEQLERRKGLLPFLTGTRVHAFAGELEKLVLERMASWPTDQPFEMIEETYHLSMDSMMKVFFTSTSPERLGRLSEVIHRFNTKGLTSPLMVMPKLRIDLGSWSPWGRVLAMKKAAADVMREEIVARQQDPEGEVYSDYMWEICHLPLKDGAPLDTETLVDEAITLIIAGHETTGAVLTWVLECILSRPKVLEAVREELDREMGDRPFEPDAIPDLDYLSAVINESIRCRPIAHMAGVRKVMQETELGGYRLAPGTVVIHCVPALGLRQETFSSPDTFDPNHFFQRKLRAYDWNAFGGGTRMCLGKTLAEVELKIAVATMLRHADLEIAQDPESIYPVRYGIFLAPNRGLVSRCRPRRPPSRPHSSGDSPSDGPPKSAAASEPGSSAVGGGCPFHGGN